MKQLIWAGESCASPYLTTELSADLSFTQGKGLMSVITFLVLGIGTLAESEK